MQIFGVSEDNNIACSRLSSRLSVVEDKQKKEGEQKGRQLQQSKSLD